MNLISVTLSDRELTHVLIALKRYEQTLLEAADDELEDSVNDLLIVQGVLKTLHEVKARS